MALNTMTVRDYRTYDPWDLALGELTRADRDPYCGTMWFGDGTDRDAWTLAALLADPSTIEEARPWRMTRS